MDNFKIVMTLVWLGGLIVGFVISCIRGLRDLKKDDHELNESINEKNLQELKKYLKKSKAIDQQQANRINTLLEESISILRQKKISNE